MTAPQKVVLAGTFEDPDKEVELGPFTQGLVIGRDPRWASQCLIDVASGTVIVVLTGLGYVQVDEDGRRVEQGGPGQYRRAFIQTYPSDATS